MSYEPLLAPAGLSNVYDEHVYKLRVLFGSTAITSYRSKDATIVRNSAGNYTITLPKTYEAVTGFSANYTLCAAGAVYFGVIKTSAIDTAGAVVVEMRTEAGTATDPASGDAICFTLGVSSDITNTKYTG